MIQLQNVSKYFRSVAAVSDISFEVNEGENMVLLGTSGCGKTTTLRMINRLEEPSTGSILVNRENILGQSPEKLRRGIGYVLQHNGLFPHYSMAENVGIVPGLLNWGRDKIKQRTFDLLDKLHLQPEQYANMYPEQLSGGQQQRVGLARALAADPPILLMDEPFGALDPVTRNTIRKDLSNLEEFKRKTIVLVTHDVQEAFELGDRICLMDKGKIVQLGTPVELLFKPANDFVRTFFDDQRLTLELQALTLNDIFTALPVSQDLSRGENFSPGTNLWNTLQSLSEGIVSTRTSVKIEKEGMLREADIPSLMAAYTNYKTTASHG